MRIALMIDGYAVYEAGNGLFRIYLRGAYVDSETSLEKARAYIKEVTE